MFSNCNCNEKKKHLVVLNILIFYISEMILFEVFSASHQISRICLYSAICRKVLFRRVDCCDGNFRDFTQSFIINIFKSMTVLDGHCSTTVFNILMRTYAPTISNDQYSKIYN